MRRFDGSGDFNRSWDEYKQGFGDAGGEYWLGNEYLHHLTNSRAYKLRFDLEDWNGNTAYAEYSSFVIEPESDNYRLRLGDYSGTASSDQTVDESNGFLYHHDNQFSTRDRSVSQSCVVNNAMAGFWYGYCSTVTPTGAYCPTDTCPAGVNGIIWQGWHGQNSLRALTMMMRPAV